MTTLTQLPIKGVSARRVRHRTIRRFPVRSEHIDFTTPCRKCGNAPTCMVKLGSVAVERTCHTCGDIEFLDGTGVAYHQASDLAPEAASA